MRCAKGVLPGGPTFRRLLDDGVSAPSSPGRFLLMSDALGSDKACSPIEGMGSESWSSRDSCAALVSSTTDPGWDACSASVGSVSSSDVF